MSALPGPQAHACNRWPSMSVTFETPPMFNTADTVTIYSNYPPGEAPPKYKSFH